MSFVRSNSVASSAVRRLRAGSAILALALALGGCANMASGPAGPATAAAVEAAVTEQAQQVKFEQDRKAILAMAGDYRVRFDFIETVSFEPDYRIKEPSRSGGYEVVRVIEDRGDFISLQHILVVGSEEDSMPIKHWRQDWRYEPDRVLVFIGGNAWENRKVTPEQAKGQWSQTVYQVEDSPRYGAMGKWTHANGLSEWTPPAEMRPLPRREATSRTDYQGILAVNRHVLTPDGWAHEQDNTKMILTGNAPRPLAREVGINTYRHYADFDETIATKYWDKTKDFWASVRADWDRLEASAPAFGLTVPGEPEPIYMPLLTLADEVAEGTKTTEAAAKEASAVIAKFTTTDIGTLAERLARPAKQAALAQ